MSDLPKQIHMPVKELFETTIYDLELQSVWLIHYFKLIALNEYQMYMM